MLIARRGLLAFTPAEQAQIDASGEENIGGIAALGKTLTLLQRIGLDLIQQEEQTLPGYMLWYLLLARRFFQMGQNA